MHSPTYRGPLRCSWPLGHRWKVGTGCEVCRDAPLRLERRTVGRRGTIPNCPNSIPMVRPRCEPPVPMTLPSPCAWHPPTPRISHLPTDPAPTVVRLPPHGTPSRAGCPAVRRGSTDPPHRSTQPANTPSTLPAPPLVMGKATDDMHPSQIGPTRDRSVMGHVMCAGRGPPGARRGPRRLAYCVADLCRG